MSRSTTIAGVVLLAAWAALAIGLLRGAPPAEDAPRVQTREDAAPARSVQRQVVRSNATEALPSPDAPGDLVIGLNQAELFSRCGIEVEVTWFGVPDIGTWHGRFPSVVYSFGDPVVVLTAGETRINGYGEYMAVAVFTSVDQAHRAFRGRGSMLPVPPVPPPEGEPMGDEMMWRYQTEGPSGPNADITFRRQNVLLTLSRHQDPSDVVGLARRIDRWIRDDRRIAPRGRFTPPPAIVDIGLPERLAVRPMEEPIPASSTTLGSRWRNPGGGSCPQAYIVIRPRFRGLGDVGRLRLKLIDVEGYGKNLLLDEFSPVGREFPKDAEPYYVPAGPRRVRAVPRSQAAAESVDGRFILRIGMPDKPDQVLKLMMIAATEDNVVVTKCVDMPIERVP